PIRKLLVRPEMGAIAGAIAVWIFFAIVAGNNGFLSLRGTSSYLSISADIGIVAVAVALLMIGGEFDLSIGSITGAAGMILAIFASDIQIGGVGFSIEILWWLAIAALATWVLLRTTFGNWIFGVGGDVNAARNVGVPVKRVKILLFMTTALAACLIAIIQAL